MWEIIQIKNKMLLAPKYYVAGRKEVSSHQTTRQHSQGDHNTSKLRAFFCERIQYQAFPLRIALYSAGKEWSAATKAANQKPCDIQDGW